MRKGRWKGWEKEEERKRKGKGKGREVSGVENGQEEMGEENQM